MLCGPSDGGDEIGLVTGGAAVQMSRVLKGRVMLQRHHVRKLGLALVAAGALSLTAWTDAEARPFGLLLGGGLPHLGGLGAFHPLGGFGGGLRPPGFGRGFYGGPLGFRQPGLGYPGFRQAGPGYRGFASVGETRRFRGGSDRSRYWRYAAPAVVGATGAYYGYSRSDSDNNDYPASGYYGYPTYRY